MDVFKFDDYKRYVRERITQLPGGGRGELAKLALELKMHTTRISHVFRGSEHLTIEQGFSLTRYFGMSPTESDYFLDLLHHAKAGTSDLKKHYEVRLKTAREGSVDLKNRLPADRVLKEQERALFYSNWFYSAIRLCSGLPGIHTIDSMAERFDLPKHQVSKAVRFLLETGLCDEKAGSLTMGLKSTHLESSSPHINRLHANWRLKAMENHVRMKDHSFAYTGPMTIRKSDAEKIRRLLVSSIEEAAKFADEEEVDSLYCLSVDWFEF